MHISVDMTTYIFCSCKLACYRFHTNIHTRDYCHTLCVAQHVTQNYGSGILYADFNWYVLMFLLLSFIHPCKLSCELNCDNWDRQLSPAGYDLFHPCLCHQCAVPACVWLVSSLFTFTACCQDLLSTSCLIPIWCHGELPRAPVYDLFRPCQCVLRVHCVLPRPVGMSCLAPVRLQVYWIRVVLSLFAFKVCGPGLLSMSCLTHIRHDVLPRPPGYLFRPCSPSWPVG